MRLWILCFLNFIEAMLQNMDVVLNGLAQNINSITSVLLALLGLFEVARRVKRWFAPVKKEG